MLVNWTDSYVELFQAAGAKISDIHSTLCLKEPYVGNSPALDDLYAHSIALAAILDYLEHDDNSDPRFNESILLCLRKLVNKNICTPRKRLVLNTRNLHQTTPVQVLTSDGVVNTVIPAGQAEIEEDTPYIDGNSQYQQDQN